MRADDRFRKQAEALFRRAREGHEQAQAEILACLRAAHHSGAKAALRRGRA